MHRTALLVIVTTIVLAINYFGLFWQTSALVSAFGSFIILGAAIVWVFRLVRHG